MWVAAALAAAPAVAFSAGPDIGSCLPAPSAEDAALLAPFYPPAAKAAGKEGSATLFCGRSDHGRLADCKLIAESPQGYGFGNAALKLAAATRDKAPSGDGPAPVTTHIPITFRFSLSKPYISPDIFSKSWANPIVVGNPRWVRTATPAEAAAAYPWLLFGEYTHGRVLLQCLVSVDGRAHCKVLKEDPPGRGFGGAALKLSSKFRFTPLTINGRPCGDGVIDIPVNYAPQMLQYPPNVAH